MIRFSSWPAPRDREDRSSDADATYAAEQRTVLDRIIDPAPPPRLDVTTHSDPPGTRRYITIDAAITRDAAVMRAQRVVTGERLVMPGRLDEPEEYHYVDGFGNEHRFTARDIPATAIDEAVRLELANEGARPPVDPRAISQAMTDHQNALLWPSAPVVPTVLCPVCRSPIWPADDRVVEVGGTRHHASCARSRLALPDRPGGYTLDEHEAAHARIASISLTDAVRGVMDRMVEATHTNQTERQALRDGESGTPGRRRLIDWEA